VKDLDTFPIPPSILVETRNGFHAYWLLKGDVSEDQFRDCQLRLAQFFNSDTQVCNPARAMRLPGFDWIKHGYPPFPVQVVSFANVRYPVQDIVHYLPDVIRESVQVGEGQSVSTKEDDGLCAHNKCKSSLPLALIVGAFPDKVPKQPIGATDAIGLSPGCSACRPEPVGNVKM
jgi:hypothetical protein